MVSIILIGLVSLFGTLQSYTQPASTTPSHKQTSGQTGTTVVTIAGKNFNTTAANVLP